MYTTPDKDGERPKFTAAEAVDLYFKNGGKIFHLPFLRKMLNPFGIFEAKYPAKNIEKILKTYLGDLKLSQAIKPCLITSYEIFQRKTVFFNKTDTIKHKELKNFKLCDIARATSAAPTYFQPAEIKSEFGEPYYMIDGACLQTTLQCAHTRKRTPLILENTSSVTTNPIIPPQKR